MQKQNRRNWLTTIGLTFAGIGLAKLKTYASPVHGILINLKSIQEAN